MLITDAKWEKIRQLFNEEEKMVLRAAVSGQVICPRGFVVDEERVPEELMTKTKEAIKYGKDTKA